MKRTLKHGYLLRKAKFGFAILVIFVGLNAVALNAKAYSETVKDTSVTAFISQYLNKDNINDLGLHYPNSVVQFYQANDGNPTWVKGQNDSKQTWEAMMLLDCVTQYGLFHEDYHPKELLYDPLHDMIEEPGKISNKRKAMFDILLTDAMITLMNNLHYGKLNPVYTAAKVDSGVMLPFSATSALIKAKQQKDLTKAIESVQPRSKLYLAMQDRMRQLKGVYQEDCYDVPETEVRKIAINMERLRWAEIDEDTYIIVNIPSYTLRSVQPASVQQFKVIVGQPSTPTPTFNSQITWITTFPKWKSIDASASKISHPGKVVLRFTNDQNITLYDAIDDQLFKKAERASGDHNIRVENGEALARLILNGDNDAIKTFNKAMDAHHTKNITLKKPVPIKVVYLTCAVRKGDVITYKDVYNLDKALEMALYQTAPVLTMK